MVTDSVIANSRNRRPTTSPMNNSGISTAISDTVSETMVKPICSEPRSAACSGGSPSSMKRVMFSIITIASSTTKPVEMVSAMRDRLSRLSLMALTISTGFVVDDAIVMIENITRFIEEGDPPLQAALRGSEQIGFTIVSLTVSLIAVLIPLLFMGDVVGRLFREFAITLSVTILISAIVSLTLVPMACAKLLKPETEAHENAFQRYSREGF